MAKRNLNATVVNSITTMLNRPIHYAIEIEIFVVVVEIRTVSECMLELDIKISLNKSHLEKERKKPTKPL